MDGSLQPVTLEPLGVVNSPRTAIRDDDWGGVEATIELDGSRFSPAALEGLDAFSHLEVIFHLHRVDEERIECGSRRPRNNPEWPIVGIFAQRAKGRPNRLGLSRCRLRGVDGLTVTVTGLDAIHGTPVLGLKPYFEEFGPDCPVEQPRWVAELMDNYHD